MTTFLTASGLALVWAGARATALYAAGLGLSRGVTGRWGRVADKVLGGRVTTGSARVVAGGALGLSKAYLVPGLSETAQVLAGVGRMPLRTYAAGLTLAALPWAAVDATIGSALVTAVTSGWGLAVVAGVSALLLWRHRGLLVGGRIVPSLAA
jgi:membrane protein DedA with SNARE-associated domain